MRKLNRPSYEQIRERLQQWENHQAVPFCAGKVFWEDTFYDSLHVSSQLGGNTFSQFVLAVKKRWPKFDVSIEDMLRRWFDAKGNRGKIEHPNRCWFDPAWFERTATAGAVVPEADKTVCVRDEQSGQGREGGDAVIGPDGSSVSHPQAQPAESTPVTDTFEQFWEGVREKPVPKIRKIDDEPLPTPEELGDDLDDPFGG